jgi:hypothetical protein
MTLKLCGLAATLSLLALVPTLAQADTVFSNLGTADTFNTTTGWSVTGAGSSNNNAVSQAFSFTPASTYTFTSFEVPLIFPRFGSNDTSSLTASLRQNSGGTPGTTLESFTRNITATAASPALSLFSSGGGITLNAGTTYWVVLAPTGNTDYLSWQRNTTGGTGLSFTLNGGPWTAQPASVSPALRVSGTLGAAAAPEPGTLALLGLGVFGAAGVLRRRKQ